MKFSICCNKSQRLIFGVQEQDKKYLSRKMLVNTDVERHFN